MTYFSPDISGSKIDYAFSDTAVFWIANQIVTFPVPMFLDTLAIATTTTIPVAYGFTTKEVDHYSTSEMLKIDPSFDRVLVTSITITQPFTTKQLVKISGQGLYPTATLAPIVDETVVNVTPDLLATMLFDINTLKTLVTQGASSTLATSLASPRLMEVDKTGALTDNAVADEAHSVDSFLGKNMIIPAQGSFFGDSMVVTRSGVAEPLVLGTDYVFANLNYGKTAEATSTSAVYDMIILTYAYSGVITLAYQAFGGDVTRSDVETLASNVEALKSYLSARQFLTLDAVKSTPEITLLNTRLVALEEDMRALMAVPRYTANSTTSGTTVVRKFQSLDTDYHWWTIGQLYKVTGADDIFTECLGTLNVSIPQLTLQFKVELGINLNTANPLQIKTLIYTGNTDPSGVIVVPRFRLIYDTLTGGAMLQLGLRPSSVTTLTLAIEDLSTAESCFLLLTSADATLPEDTAVTLPDGVTVWYDGTDPVSTRTVAPASGYPVAVVENGTASLVVSDFTMDDIRTVMHAVTGGYTSIVPHKVSGSVLTLNDGTVINPASASVTSSTTDGVYYAIY